MLQNLTVNNTGASPFLFICLCCITWQTKENCDA
uniref:Uncharacterized protein n=1 Tax=Arundo donax TaxID=35708 RepID=A0A0A9DJV7_ARUDO